MNPLVDRLLLITLFAALLSLGLPFAFADDLALSEPMSEIKTEYSTNPHYERGIEILTELEPKFKETRKSAKSRTTPSKTLKEVSSMRPSPTKPAVVSKASSVDDGWRTSVR